MAARSLGKVSVASTTTGVRLTNNIASIISGAVATDHYNAQSFTAQALPANTGEVFICDTQTPNFTTGIGVCWVVAQPTTTDGTSVPLLSVANDASSGSFDLSKLWLVPSVSGEGCYITSIRT